MQYTISIEGMSCQHCVKAVTRALEAVEGVQHVDVQLQPGTAIVQGDVGLEKALRGAIEEEEYSVVGIATA